MDSKENKTPLDILKECYFQLIEEYALLGTTLNKRIKELEEKNIKLEDELRARK